MIQDTSRDSRVHEVWLAAQKEAFQAALDGASLEASLGVLVRVILAQAGDGARCAFYIADANRTELHHVTGMSEAYAECVDGFKIASDSLACGLAVYTGQPVITADVTQESRWAPWLWLAERYRYRACWSFPIETATGKVVGTLAMYFEEPRAATPDDHKWAGMITRSAAIIISRNQEIEDLARAVQALRMSEAALRSALDEREALLKEVHHRVKNNLQVIMGLLEMQADRAANPQALASLTEARSRVGAIASMHELLYRSDSLSEVDLPAYVRRLVSHVVSFYRMGSRLKVSVAGEDIRVDLARAVPLGLLMNELVSNVCKHAFPGEAEGELEIDIDGSEREIRVRVKDTGAGIPDGVAPRSTGSLGLQLVHMLARQVGGGVTFESSGGTRVDVVVPRRAASA